MNKSAEEYIKTIYLLKEKLGCVHSVDVAREMSFSKASVSVAMSNLRKKNIIRMSYPNRSAPREDNIPEYRPLS